MSQVFVAEQTALGARSQVIVNELKSRVRRLTDHEGVPR
jgi:hypothetical protein